MARHQHTIRPDPSVSEKAATSTPSESESAPAYTLTTIVSLPLTPRWRLDLGDLSRPLTSLLSKRSTQWKYSYHSDGSIREYPIQRWTRFVLYPLPDHRGTDSTPVFALSTRSGVSAHVQQMAEKGRPEAPNPELLPSRSDHRELAVIGPSPLNETDYIRGE